MISGGDEEREEQGQDRRIIGTSTGVALVVSTMVGTGIFTTTGLMAGMGAGSGDIIVAWLLGGVFALCGSLCYGELAANMPRSGGEYYFIGRLLHPALGFLSGWTSLIVGFSAPIAAVTMAMHLYIARAVPGWPVQEMTVITIILLSLMHAHDLRLGGRVQVGLVLLKLILICGFILGAYASAWEMPPRLLADMSPSFWFTSPFAVTLILVAFSYSGWNAAAYIGSEIHEPGQTLPRALIRGTLAVTVLYVLVNCAYFSVVSTAEIAGVESVAHTVGTVLWGSTGGVMVSLLIAAGLVATVSAMMITGPRVYEAMARDRFLPQRFARLNRRGVPSWAVGLQSLAAILFAVTSSFEALLVYIGYTLNIFAGLAVFSVFVMRKRGLAHVRVCRGYPITPFVFLVFVVWMTVWSIGSHPVSTVAGLATLAAGYIVYVIQSRYRKGGAPGH